MNVFSEISKKILNKAEAVLTRLEEYSVHFNYFLLTFFFATTLRNFLEMYFNGEIRNSDILVDLFHYDVSYVCLALAIIVLFYFATKEKITKIARVVLPCFLILLLAPIIDLFSVSWRNFNIAYMFPGEHQNIIMRFFTFFGPLDKSGVTLGMRIEIALVISASFVYFRIKKQSIIRAVVFSFLMYCMLFTYCAIPFVFKAFMDLLRIRHTFSLESMTHFYLLLMFILGAWTFYLYNKKYFVGIMKDIRLLRLLHFELMFVFGIVLSEIVFKKPILLDQQALFSWILTMIAVCFAWLFSVATNNIADYDIDKISNQNRPTVSGAIDDGHYRKLALIFIVGAVVYSVSVDFIHLFLILVFIGNYFLYSMPPIRFKRVPFFSKLVISINSLILIILGQFSHSGNFGIHAHIIVFFLVCITAAMNFIDIKDYKGDKAAGIRTLPTIFGLEKSKKIIGAFFIVSYFAACFVFKCANLLVPFLGMATIQFFFITKKDYDERPVLVMYLLSVAVLIIYLRQISGVQ